MGCKIRATHSGHLFRHNLIWRGGLTDKMKEVSIQSGTIKVTDAGGNEDGLAGTLMWSKRAFSGTFKEGSVSRTFKGTMVGYTPDGIEEGAGLFTPVLRAERYYRHQIMLRAPRMRALSQRLARVTQGLVLPEDVTLSVDIDPVNLG